MKELTERDLKKGQDKLTDNIVDTLTYVFGKNGTKVATYTIKYAPAVAAVMVPFTLGVPYLMSFLEG